MVATNNKQTKSKKRTVDFGEVYTNRKEINGMLDMIRDESFNIDSKFLEPAMGNGNFVMRILERKMISVKKIAVNETEYAILMLKSVANIYGIDILQDNVTECIQRAMKYLIGNYYRVFKCNMNDDLKKSLEYILSKNLICGDSLTNLNFCGKTIVFCDWVFSGCYVERQDFYFTDIIANPDNNKPFKIHNKILSTEVFKLG